MPPRKPEHESPQRAALAAGISLAIVDKATEAVARYLGCDKPAARRMLMAAIHELERRGL